MGGKSSGGGGHTPYEAPDSLKSAQRLRAIGLISLGPIKGPVNKWKSTYFDNTPIQNENGVDDNDKDSFNYKNTEIQFTLGTQDQAPLKGFEMSEREVTVNTEVKNTTPITRTVTDPDVTRIRLTLGVNALYSQNDQGDTNGTSVSFSVLINGRFRSSFEINGKSSSRFYKCYIIDDLPERPFNITVERNTPDSKSQRLQNATNWVSYTEIIDTKLSYPNMALVGIKTDSRYNPNFPNVNLLLYGRIIKVPSTYDPETRTYATGIWKGDWKEGWTNNPAWVFYDLVTDPLGGLGKRIGDYGLDKFQLYQIAKYCDELVPDGFGGQEPRMTANAWITEQRNAYDVVSDMASVFRAIAIWTGTQFSAIQDRTSDPVCLYNQSNVIDGKFNRQYAALKSIYTAAEVEFADERNMYQSAVEYVADDLMIERYGYNTKKLTAFATTTRGQAHRWGKWVLATSLLEQCTITFAVGRQGLMHLPGDIIEIADNDFAGKTLGGRVVAISDKKVTLDQPVDITGESYLSWLNDDMKLTKVKITQVDAKNKAIVTLASKPVGLEPMDDWVLKTPAVSTQLYRAIGITENDDGSYTITALQHEPQKEAIVDGSASFMPVATTAHTGGLSAIQNAEVMATDGGILLTFTQPSFIGQGLKYQVKLYRDKKLYDIYDDLPEPQLAFNDLPDGEYVAEIRAKNAAGQLSEPKTVTFTVSFTITELVTVPRIFAIDLNWKNPLFANTKSSIELWVSSDNNFNNARKLVTLVYPTNSYTYSGLGLTDRFWFWARMTDGYNSGKFTEVVEGVPSSDSTQLTSYLDGQITKSHLGQSLIESLQSDINDAVAGEAGVRKSAVANAVSQIIAETQARVKALQDEAKARGTAVTQLQQTDAQQAQLINAVTAKADQAIAGLQEEKTARANADKANAGRITSVTSRVASAESSISNIQSTKASKTEVASLAQQSLQAVWQADAQAKVDAISVGGRNLLLGTRKALSGTGEKLYQNQRYDFTPNVDVSTLTTITLSCDIAIKGVTENATKNGHFRIGVELQLFYADGSRSWLSVYRTDKSDFTGRISKTMTLAKPLRELTYNKVQVRSVGNAEQYYVGGAKLEIGNVATDWTPAPEDADGAISAISSKVDSVQQTLTTANQALGSRLDTVTASVNDAKSQVSQVSKAVSDVRGKLSATSTLKTQVIAGGRKAIAGIALGAESDGKTTESSVILMADKFGVVKNAADGNVVSMLSVVDNKVAVNGDLIAEGTILGKHLRANQTIQAPTINGGTITGNKINGGTITGTTISGSTINGTNINGGTIKGTRFEAVEMEVVNLIGGGIFESKIINEVKLSGRFNNELMATVKIRARNTPRLIRAFSHNMQLKFVTQKSLAKHNINEAVVKGIPLNLQAGALFVPANTACTLELRMFPSGYQGGNTDKAYLADLAYFHVNAQVISSSDYINEVPV
ncbi:phage tail protein [Pasteurella bettyae]|uniref:phage tail protein n=1 Tax=Pasteurella bettyae TaxID=752 RepID=UPI003D2CF2E2